MRARNVKPGLFENEILATLPHWVRLLFVGLWCMADRAGRLEDRPARIHRSLFPGEDLDVDSGLAMLADAGFISRYTVDGVSCIQVLAWERHQSPHCKERESELPSMPGRMVKSGKLRDVRVADARPFAVADTIRAQCEHGADIEQAPQLAAVSPADVLIADSQSLKADAGGVGHAAKEMLKPPARSSHPLRRPDQAGPARLNARESAAENQAAYERHIREMGCEP